MTQKNMYSMAGATGLWISIALSAIVPIGLGFLLAESFPDWRWNHYPFHAMVESIGALSALIIATLMVILLKIGRLSRRYILVACALIGMGLLDGFHAVLHVGVSFVWLHSIATLVGGLIFATIWLPDTWLSEKKQPLLLYATVTLSMLAGIVSIALPDILPVMVIDGEFSLPAKIINITGGIGFLAGATFFINDFRKVETTTLAKRKRYEDMVFANHCLLFGIAGLLFETSVLWDAGWWWWHVLRLLAYFVVLVYFFVLFKSGQDQLVESEDRFRLINSRLPGIVYQFKIDANGRRSLLYVSPTVENYLGLSAATVKDNVEKWFALTHPDDLQSLEKSIVESMNNMTVWKWEGRFVRKDEEVIWLSGSSVPRELPDGSVVWEGVFTDITERKRVEKILREKAVIIDQIHDSVISSDMEGIITGWNKGSERLFGYSSDEMLGKHVASVYPEEEHDFLKNEVIAPLQRKGEHESEVRMRRKSGEDFYAHLSLSLLYDDQGNARGMIGYAMDISERKQSEHELSREKAKAQNYLDIVGVMLVALNSNGEVTLINRKGCQLLGCSEESIKGKNWFNNFIPERHRGEIKDVFARLMKGESELAESYENLIVTSSGEEKLIKWNNILFYNDDGDNIGILSSGEDITEQREVELELEQYRHQLEELVYERTMKLQQAQDELVRKERLATLGQLIATVSHELRNPLGAMRPSVYILNKYSDKNNQRVNKSLEVIDKNIDRCDHIIDELLDFTRITELDRHATIIDDWLDSVIDEQNIPEGIQVEKDFTLSEVCLVIDANRLRRAIINVVDNACHAMMNDRQQVKNEESAHLLIKTRHHNGRIEISISDSGAGIAKHVLDRIYEPLFSTKGFGVGLGMPTVRQIMQQHGGGIAIDTEEGKGTSVTLWLPMSAVKERSGC